MRAIHAKVANARRHHLHEQSTRLVRENRLIAAGNIGPLDVTGDLPADKGRRHIRKSILNASWSSFRLIAPL
jgi:putative transposase